MTSGDDQHHFPELTEAEKIRWQATHSDMKAMSEGLQSGATTSDDIRGALNRLTSHGIEHDTLVNALHIPADAGPYAEALEQILRRIPDGWGRWISHDAGWYPIVTGLDERLAAIDPNYAVHQVKEKFGTLRYYAEPSGEPTPARWESFAGPIREAERESAVTCELCGAPGVLHKSAHRLKTLCIACADAHGYAAAPPRR
jgi:hypothetical protein